MYNKKVMLNIITNKHLPYLTVGMMNELFYSGKSYFSACKVLRTLYDRGYLKRYSCKLSNDTGRSEYIYYNEELNPEDKKEKKTRHRLITCMVVMELLKLSFEGIIDVKAIGYEVPVNTVHMNRGALYKVDAVVDFMFRKERVRLYIESDVTHYTSKQKLLDLDYHNLMVKNEGQDDYVPVYLVVRQTVKECSKKTLNLTNLFYITPEVISLWIRRWLKEE